MARPDRAFTARLGPADRDALAELGVVRSYRRGASLFVEGERSDHVLFLLTGEVRVWVATLGGRDVLLELRGPGDVLGELAAVDGRPRSASATALAPVTARVLAAEAFRDLLAHRPGVAFAVLEQVAERLRAADRARVQQGERPVVGRLCSRIVQLLDDAGPATDGTAVELPVTQEQLAGWVGVSRETVVRALTALRTDEVLATGRRRLVVLDIAALRRLAADDPVGRDRP